MKRKEYRAKSITQDNDATCHKATKRSKRNASKKARQAMQHEVKEAVAELLSTEHQLRIGIMQAFSKAIDAGYEVDLLGLVSSIDHVPDVRLREHKGVPEFWAREVFEVFKDRGIVPADTDIDAKIEELRDGGYRFAPESVGAE